MLTELFYTVNKNNVFPFTPSILCKQSGDYNPSIPLNRSSTSYFSRFK